MAEWRDLPFNAMLNRNLPETAVRNQATRLENCYVGDTDDDKPLIRFPVLTPWVTLGGDLPTYLNEHKGDLLAVTGGRAFTLSKNGTKVDRTGVAVRGGKRVIFDHTDNEETLMAAGSQIIRLQGATTEVLDANAPETTHVAYNNGYVLAIEPNSQRIRYTESGVYTSWPDLNIFSAEAKPDKVTAMIMTEFGELITAGPESIQQFDVVAAANPFSPRWLLGSGLKEAYTLLSLDNQIWGLNNETEFVSFSIQTGVTRSKDIQKTLERIDNWKDAWATEFPYDGHRFIIMQAPYATNDYGTVGVTWLYDYVQSRWYNLFGWDEEIGLPDRWAGWSYYKMWERHFVGGNGVIYELTDAVTGADRQRMVWRSGHIRGKGLAPIRIDKLRMALNRGYTPQGDGEPVVSLRLNKDNQGFGPWVRGSIGSHGKYDMVINFPALGTADTFQFEIEIIDSAHIVINSVEALMEGLE